MIGWSTQKEAMDMKWRISLVILVGLALASVGAVAVPDRDRFEGEGTWLRILGGGRVYKLSADEECWVRHGWTGSRVPGVQPDIKDAQGDRKAVNAGHSFFELYINDEPVKLNCRVITEPGGPDGKPGEREVHYDYYVQFPANYFAPGTYTLKGVWDRSNPNVIGGELLPRVDYATLIIEPVITP
jgi:hypothetical protein